MAADASAQRKFDLPLLEDANSVQIALMKVVQMLGSGKLDHKTAGLMLYALQTASINLRNTDFEADEVTDVVIDRDTVAATCIKGPQWFEEDFERDDESHDETEAEAEAENQEETAAGGQDIANVAPANADSPTKTEQKNELKHIGLDEARKQVQGAIRQWVSENAVRTPQ